MSFRPETAPFRNLCVNLLNFLCDVPRYASAQLLVFLDLAENCSFLNWKLTLVPIEFLRFVGALAMQEIVPVGDLYTIRAAIMNFLGNPSGQGEQPTPVEKPKRKRA